MCKDKESFGMRIVCNHYYLIPVGSFSFVYMHPLKQSAGRVDVSIVEYQINVSPSGTFYRKCERNFKRYYILVLKIVIFLALKSKRIEFTGKKCKTAILLYCFDTTEPVLSIIMFKQWSCCSRTLGDDCLAARFLS